MIPRFVQTSGDMFLTLEAGGVWYSPNSVHMNDPYADVFIGREAHAAGNLKLQQHAWLTQLATPRCTLIRRTGATARYIVVGCSVGRVGWMWELKEHKNKPGFWYPNLDAGKHELPFSLLNLDDWVLSTTTSLFAVLILQGDSPCSNSWEGGTLY